MARSTFLHGLGHATKPLARLFVAAGGAVKDFTAFFGRSPDSAAAADLRRYRLHMRSNGASPTSMNAAVSALRFFLGVTLGQILAVQQTTLTPASHPAAVKSR